MSAQPIPPTSTALMLQHAETMPQLLAELDKLLEMEANPHGGTYAQLCAQYKRVRDLRNLVKGNPV